MTEIKRSNYGSSHDFLKTEIEDNLGWIWILADKNYGTTENIMKSNDVDKFQVLSEREIFFKSALETLNALSLKEAIKRGDEN